MIFSFQEYFIVTLFLLEYQSVLGEKDPRNNAARIVFKNPKHDLLPFLRSLHCLLITQWIDYELSFLSFSVVYGTDPEYLPDLLTTHTSSRQLRPASDTRPTFLSSKQRQKDASVSGTIFLKLLGIPSPSPYSSLL